MVPELNFREILKPDIHQKTKIVYDFQTFTYGNQRPLLRTLTELNDEIHRVRSRHAAVATLLDDLKSVAGAYERPAKRATITRLCEAFFTVSSTVAFSALLTETDHLKNCCEALALEN